MAVSKVRAGFGDIFIAGGIESMSLLPMTGYKLAPSYNANMENMNYHIGMGHTAEAVAEKYKIVWEIPMKHLIDMSADRGAFICQSQSLNLWMKEPKYDKLTSMHVYSWKKGLKTGIYYLRTKAKAAPQQFTIEPDQKNVKYTEDDDEICEMCSG